MSFTRYAVLILAVPSHSHGEALTARASHERNLPTVSTAVAEWTRSPGCWTKHGARNLWVAKRRIIRAAVSRMHAMTMARRSRRIAWTPDAKSIVYVPAAISKTRRTNPIPLAVRKASISRWDRCRSPCERTQGSVKERPSDLPEGRPRRLSEEQRSVPSDWRGAKPPS